MVNDLAVELELPDWFPAIHPVFHVDTLKPYVTTDTIYDFDSLVEDDFEANDEHVDHDDDDDAPGTSM